MSNLSLRGVDAPTLARIRSSASRRKVSVNRVIVEALQQQFRAAGPARSGIRALAGKWTAAQADAFDAAVAPFSEIEAGLWLAEPTTPYRVTPIATAAADKSGASARKRAKSAINGKDKKVARK